ncbi:MAG: hypothetical protein V1734_04150 [Nanoarchaeota archaeon]
MEIHDRLPKGDWKLVRLASKAWLELVVNAYIKAGAEDVACIPKNYGVNLPPLEKEYKVYVKGGFDIKKLEERLFN